MNKKLKVKNLQLSYEEIGQGKQTLLFIHGLACDHRDWEYQMAYFKNNYKCLALDLRGHGTSDGTEAEDYLISTFAEDAKQLIEQMENKSVVLIGHSLGCRIVLELYNQVREKISHLVLVDGSRVGQGDPEEVKKTISDMLDTSDYNHRIMHLFLEMLSDITDSKVKERIIKNTAKLSRGVTQKVAPEVGAWDAVHFDTITKTLEVPVLLIQSTYLNADKKRILLKKGDSSPFIDLFKSRVPSLQVQIVEEAGHFPMLEQPDFVNKAIERFLLWEEGKKIIT